MLARSVHGSILEGVCCGGYAQLYGNQAWCRGGRVEGITNRGLCGRDGSAFDQETVTKIRDYYHVHRGSHCHALTTSVGEILTAGVKYVSSLGTKDCLHCSSRSRVV